MTEEALLAIRDLQGDLKSQIKDCLRKNCIYDYMTISWFLVYHLLHIGESSWIMISNLAIEEKTTLVGFSQLDTP